MKLFSLSTERKFVINSKYSNLTQFIQNVPFIFDKEGRVIYRIRNEIRVFDVAGVSVNVKRYCIPPLFFNRIIYSIFRAPKAKRAYYYGFKLIEMGIDTPYPIGYILESRSLMLGYSYFISIQVPYYRDMREFEGLERIDNESDLILTDFGKFTADLHTKGIYHKDYSPGNIMFKIVDGVTKFCLVDTNRMRFGKVSIKRGCKNFARLWGNAKVFNAIAKSYANRLHISYKSTFDMMIRANKIFFNRQKFKLRVYRSINL